MKTFPLFSVPYIRRLMLSIICLFTSYAILITCLKVVSAKCLKCKVVISPWLLIDFFAKSLSQYINILFLLKLSPLAHISTLLWFPSDSFLFPSLLVYLSIEILLRELEVLYPWFFTIIYLC